MSKAAYFTVELTIFGVLALALGLAFGLQGRPSGMTGGLNPGVTVLALYAIAVTAVCMWLVRRTREVTQRQRARSAQARAILEVDGRQITPYFSIDAHGDLTYINKAAAALFRCDWRDVVDQAYTKLMDESSLRQHDVFIADGDVPIANSSRAIEIVGRRSDGTCFPLEVSFATLIHEQRGNLVVVYPKDLTEQKEKEEELHRAVEAAAVANRTKSAFLANMSHEIRTPMTAIIGIAELCLRTGLDGVQRDYLVKLHSSARSLLGIVNDILDFSKIEAGELALEEVVFDIDKVLDEVAALLALKSREKRLELVFERGKKVPKLLKGDPLRLKQVLVNLCNNAIKFTERGEILLKMDVLILEGTTVDIEITVRDTGIGMSADQMSALFKPFSQADSSTSRRYGGTGLGLSICRQLVEAMGGEIDVQSTPGIGTVFRATVRLGVPEQGNSSMRTHRFDGMRVLGIIENSTTSAVIERYLREFGFTTVIEANESQGLARMGSEAFDLVLLDVGRKSVVQKHEIVGRLKSRLDHRAKLLLLDDTGDEAADGELEVHGVLCKPVNPSSLLDAIVEVFGHGSVDAVAHASKTPTTRLDGMCVLLVEDNAINQMVATELLEQAGIEVEVAGNGIEGIEALSRGTFDCVLMDIQMPEMDGYEATRRIRAQPMFKDLPVLAMTANVMKEDREKSLACGMDGHIGKPIDIEELLAALQAVSRRLRSETLV